MTTVLKKILTQKIFIFANCISNGPNMMGNNRNIEDTILSKGILEGNRRIFDYIFLSHYSGLVIYATRLGLDMTAAEDAVQDVFLNLWNQRAKIYFTTSVKAYLFTCVRNKCYNILKHRKTSLNIQNLASAAVNDVDSRDYVIESELRKRIDEAIARLPEKCRKIFILNQIEGIRPAKIAIMENISIRTVENHIGKAYRLLRQDLGDMLFVIFLLSIIR